MNKLIYRFILAVAVLFSATANVFSQSYSITPNDTIQVTGIFEDLETLSISQINTTSNPIILRWEKVSVFISPNWEASICDNSACSTVLDDSGTMDPVIPADYGFLLLHITAHVDTGTAVIRYAVWDISTPTLRDTLTFIMTVNSVSGIEESDLNPISLYPNPADNNFNITTKQNSEYQFSISDISGKEINFGSSITNNLSISSEQFSNGAYFVSLKGKNFNFKKKIIIHHNN